MAFQISLNCLYRCTDFKSLTNLAPYHISERHSLFSKQVQCVRHGTLNKKKEEDNQNYHFNQYQCRLFVQIVQIFNA